MNRPDATGASALEVFLARLYAEPGAAEAFAADPEPMIAAAGLCAADAAALRTADRVGLVMAARSYARKRESRRRGGSAA